MCNDAVAKDNKRQHGDTATMTTSRTSYLCAS